MEIEEIKSKIENAANENKKMAMFHFLCLINAQNYHSSDSTDFCKDIGVSHSYGIEFRKMIKLSRIIEDEGWVLKKKPKRR